MGRIGTLAWLTVAFVAALAIATASWQLGAKAVPSAFAAESRLSALRQMPLGQLLSSDESAALDNLRRQITQAKNDLEPAQRLARWAERFSPAVSWLPMARREVTAWTSQAARVQKDLDAASELLDSSSLLLDVYSQAQASLVSAGNGSSVAPLKKRVQELEASFATSLEAVSDASDRGRAFSIGFYAPPIRDTMRVLDELEVEMLTASRVGEQVSGLLGGLVEVAGGAQPLIGQFSNAFPAENETGSFESFKATLAKLTEDALSTKRQSEDVARLLVESGQAVSLLSKLTALDQMLDVLMAVSSAAVSSLDALGPVADLRNSFDSGLLAGSEGLGDIFTSFAEHSDDIDEAIDGLETAQVILGELASGENGAAIAGRLSDLKGLVGQLEDGLKLMSAIAPLGRELLGFDGMKTYLVLGQSADELRGTGGFVSSVWLVTFENGGLVDIRYQDAVRVDDWDRLMLYPLAPPGLEEHMNAWVWLLRDVSWDPDFPTTARSAEDLFRLGRRQQVDGVIAINQWTLLRLIDALGNIPSPDGDEPITARNLLSSLEEGTDQYGRAYMDLALQGVLECLNGAISMPGLIRLSSALRQTLQERDMLVFLNDPALQSVMSEFGWDGSVRQESADYLHVVDSNVGWSKADRNIERDVSYVVDLDRGSRPRVSLTLGYSNHSGPGSSGCEPQWLNRGTNYSQLKNACYWNFLRVYIPQEARVLSNTPLPLPEQSVSVEIGRGVPGQETGGISSSHNKMVFSGLDVVGAGERSEISLVYDLPASVVRRDGDNLTYELLIQKQPGVRLRAVSIEIMLPEGYGLASSSVPATSVGDSRVGFDINLTQDTILTVEFNKDKNGSD